MCTKDSTEKVLEKQTRNIKNVLVLYVGGTVGMQKNSDGAYVPVPNAFLSRIKNNPTMHNSTMAELLNLESNQLVLPEVNENIVIYKLIEYNPLLDSSNMTIEDWMKIAKDLKKYYSEYNGFVVLQGTDTMAYTTSALSFMLENLQKPVIVTGSQVSLFEVITDARDNIVEAIIIAGCYSDIHEVGLYFSRRLFRGNRTVKQNNVDFDAFNSLNYPPLANIGVDIYVHKAHLLKNNCNRCRDKLTIFTNLSRNVASLSFFPTLTASQLEDFLKSPLEGLVLHTYGTGNMPSDRKEIIDVLKKAIKREILIVNITLCPKGVVSNAYETGKVLEEIGVISGHDMTPEAAFTKLSYVLGKAEAYQSRLQLLKDNLRGEFTDYINNKNNNNN